MDVAYDANRFFNLYEVSFGLEHLESRHKKTHNLGFGNRALPVEEVFQEAPIWHIIRAKERTVLDRLIDHAWTLLIGKGSIGDGIRQQTEACL